MKFTKSMSGIYLSFITGGLLVGIPMTQKLISLRPLETNNPDVFNSSQINPSQPVSEDTIIGAAKQISISSVGIDVPVSEGVYNPELQSWTLSNNSAFHAENTPNPNNKNGNVFIYAHAEQNLFGALPKMKLGDLAEVKTDNHRVFRYRLIGSKQIKPDNTELFNYQGKPILTLQTCSGLWYENRTLFVFELMEVL